MRRMYLISILAACGGSSGSTNVDAYPFMDAPSPLDSPLIGGCSIFPTNHIFNTQIGALPVDPMSGAYLSTIGTKKIHLDLGTETDESKDDYYGIPYNVVNGTTLTWPTAAFLAVDTGDYDWKPADESDCADSSHAVVSPCKPNAPILPIPATPLIESGINTSADQTPDDDHHMLMLDADTCRLWEAYHVYSTAGTWDIFGSATWDLRSNALRPADWTSTDAAGFPILPLLLRADEASSGVIKHAVRFTIESSDIRAEYAWPARHITGSDMTATHPPMGQLFRLKATFVIPDSDNVQARAILQALKTYGMYVADGGSDWYIQGEPSANWADDTFTQVQSVTSDNFEAVDITAITSRAGFDPNSAAVP